MIVGFIAKGFLENKTVSLKNEIISDLEKSLRDFDAKYESLQKNYTDKLNSILDPIALQIGSNTIEDGIKQKLESLYNEFHCSSLYIIASNSKFISVIQDESGFYHRREFISSMGEAILAYANKKIVDNRQTDIFSNLLNPEASEFVRLYQKYIRNVTEMNMGELSLIYYAYCFGDKTNYNNYILMLT